jgi:hypothetical protein
MMWMAMVRVAGLVGLVPMARDGFRAHAATVAPLLVTQSSGSVEHGGQ